jgi:flagellar hook-length control protein FliK
MNLNALSSTLATTDGSTAGAAALPQDDSGFAQLLGQHRLPTAQPQGKLNVCPALAHAPEAPPLGHQSPTTLNAHAPLLAEPQEPRTSAEDKLPQTQSDTEEPLQVLFAMLPAAVMPALSGNGLARDVETLPSEPAPNKKPLLSTTPLDTAHTQQNVGQRSTLAAKTDAAVVLSAEHEGSQNASTSALKPLQAASSLPSSQHQSSPLQSSPLQSSPRQPTDAPPVSSPLVAPQQTSATVSPPSTPQLNAQLGSPEWQQALSQQVLMFHRNGQQSAELRLHPQELGALQITLKLENNQAQLHIASVHGLVRSAVEAALPQLRQALADSGIHLGQSSVGSESLPQSSQQHASSQQSSSHQQAAHPHGQSTYREQHGSAEAEIENLIVPVTLQAMTRSVEGVDTFV